MASSVTVDPVTPESTLAKRNLPAAVADAVYQGEGANLDLKNRRGKTTLQLAKDEGHAECVRVIEDFLERDCRSQADMLLEGASPSPSPEWSTSGGAFLDVLPPAVVAACQGEEDEAVSGWLANGGQIDATFSYSDGSMHTSDLTLLMTAANTGNKAMVDMLLGHGADVDKKNRFGNTALSQAAAKGHERVVDALLRAGADINVQNTKGGTALFLAVSFDHPTIVRRLLGAGADPEVRDTNGDSAKQFAKRNGRAKCTRILKDHLCLVASGWVAHSETEDERQAAAAAAAAATEERRRRQAENKARRQAKAQAEADAKAARAEEETSKAAASALAAKREEAAAQAAAVATRQAASAKEEKRQQAAAKALARAERIAREARDKKAAKDAEIAAAAAARREAEEAGRREKAAQKAQWLAAREHAKQQLAAARAEEQRKREREARRREEREAWQTRMTSPSPTHASMRPDAPVFVPGACSHSTDRTSRLVPKQHDLPLEALPCGHVFPACSTGVLHATLECPICRTRF